MLLVLLSSYMPVFLVRDLETNLIIGIHVPWPFSWSATAFSENLLQLQQCTSVTVVASLCGRFIVHMNVSTARHTANTKCFPLYCLPSEILSMKSKLHQKDCVVIKHSLDLTFAVDFSFFLSLGGGLQTLATFCTAETVFMPGLQKEEEFRRCTWDKSDSNLPSCFSC